MDPRTFPTKGNLMLAKNSLALAQQGYDLMDKKRNILIRELMDLIDEAAIFRTRLIRPLPMHTNVCSVQISNMELTWFPSLHIQFQSKILL